MNIIVKTAITGALVSTLISASAFAKGPDENRGPKIDPAERFEYIFDQLELSEDQRTSVLDIMEALREENREQMQANREAMQNAEERPSREEMDALREAKQAAMRVQLTDQLNTVLSAEDATALVDYLDFHHRLMAGGQHRPNRPPMPAPDD
jgi:Spy/CpxP family protein refolding chaperone